MGSILLFAVATYGLTFLIADATLFGCSAHDYPENPTYDEWEAIKQEGIVKIRQRVLRVRFFQKLLGCYFCTGVWTGIVMHWVLLWYAHVNPSWRNSYLLWGPFELWSGLLGSFVAACAGGTVCYGIDRAIVYLETRSETHLSTFGE